MTYGRPGVYITERLLPAPQAIVGTANAAGAAIGKFAQGPDSVTLVTSWYDFVKKFGSYSAAYPATFGVSQFFNNGGSELYVRRVLGTGAAAATATLKGTGDVNIGTVSALAKGDDGNWLRVQFSKTAQAHYFNLTVYREGGTSKTDSSATNDIIVEQFNNVVLNDALSSDYVSSVVNLNSQYISIVINDANELDPLLTRVPLISGAAGVAPVKTNYTAAIADFSVLDRPLVLFAPEINVDLDPADAVDVHNGLITWAEANNGFVVVDTEADLTVDNALAAADGLTPVSSHAAVYYPNVYISDPLGRSSSSLRKIGPAGSVAGLYIQTDKTTGPFKAPAGLRATLRGAVALERQFTNAELDQLNTGTKTNGDVNAPINAIRNTPGAGIVVMGARTLLQDGTANKNVNTRRSLIYIRKSLTDLSQFALFENNDEKLWARLRTTISVFLTTYKNLGGLRGATPGEAFYVKVDKENNPDSSIANGEVHIEVGVALQYPAEFVVINLSQKTSV